MSGAASAVGSQLSPASSLLKTPPAAATYSADGPPYAIDVAPDGAASRRIHVAPPFTVRKSPLAVIAQRVEGVVASIAKSTGRKVMPVGARVAPPSVLFN